MPVNLDDMTIQQLRKHARDVAKAIARREAERANQLRQRVVSYTQELGENIGEFFSKKDTPPTKKDTQPAKTEAKPSSKGAKPARKSAKPAASVKTKPATSATSAKAKPAKPATSAKAKASTPPKYIEPDGTPRQRLGKWSEKYTKKQIEAMKQK